MTTAVPAPTDWRRENAKWMRTALRWLRLRLRRHALLLGDPARRRADWLVAADDAELETVPPGDDDAALEASLQDLERRHPEGRSPALSRIALLAGLNDFERHLLLLAAAPALDGAFARAYAELHDDLRRDHATLHLGLSLFTADVTDRLLAADCLLPTRPLRQFRLLDAGDDDREPLLTRPLRVDDRVCDYLRGINRADRRVTALIADAEEMLSTASALAAAGQAATCVGASPGRWSTINVVGDADGAREAARLACLTLDFDPQCLDLRRFAAADPAERAELVALFSREALLARMALIVDATTVDRGSATALAVDELIATLAGPLFVMSADVWPGGRADAVVRTARPTRLEQRELWRLALARRSHSVNGEVDAITQQFDFGPGAIASVVARAAQRGDDITSGALWSACREQSGAALEDLARRISPSYGWDDIVVPDDVRGQLRELASQVQQRGRVYQTWGFGARLGRGRGISALFAGASGTGKTMAAEILAAHLDLDLYRIDLAGLVSKYIGETEKNLRRVFDAAERSGAILFFDEADALFGSRMEVRDSHDRYANLEVNYLLQRMEDYSGLAILATNRRSALDSAFLRRLRFVIDFRLPGIDDRRRIWERAFPAQAEMAGLDLSLLSGLELSGGSITSVAVNAAFLAAADGGAIGMTHVVQAATREYVKLAKPISAAEFGPYYPAVRR